MSRKAKKRRDDNTVNRAVNVAVHTAKLSISVIGNPRQKRGI